MNFAYRTAELVIIIEFSLVIVILLLTIFSKCFNILYDKRNKKIKLEIEKYIYDVIRSPKKLISKEFPKQLKKLDILLDCIDEFDAKPSPNQWHAIRDKFINQIILPIAINAANEYGIKSRFNAARALTLIKKIGNDEIINTLVASDIPIIYHNAIIAAIMNHSELAINSIIQKMADQPWARQNIYLQGFSSLPIEERVFYEKKLASAMDPNIRAVLYNIMRRFPSAPIGWNVSQDINSDNIELKISALKFISYVDREVAIPYLVTLLNDPDWEVRLVAIRRLNMLHAEKEISELSKYLKDKDWWVRTSIIEGMQQTNKLSK